MVSEDESERNVWQRVLARLRSELDSDEFRRWLDPTAYASDSGDLITVWTPTESVRRHLTAHYDETIRAALAAVGRGQTNVRFVVSGVEEDESETDE